MRITLVTVPFSGHFKILEKLADTLQKNNHQVTIISTGWKNIVVPQSSAANLEKSNIQLISLQANMLEQTSAIDFTFPRVCELTEEVISKCKNSDLIIYDFFSPEGYIAGKTVGIPTICSIPAIIGEFKPDSNEFLNAISKNRPWIASLEQKYNLSLFDKLQLISDGFFIAADENKIVWSWPKFVKATNYLANRKLNHCLFARPDIEISTDKAQLLGRLDSFKKHKKLIYFSLGTVVTGHLWERDKNSRTIVKAILDDLIKKFGDNSQYEVILSLNLRERELVKNLPENFESFSDVPQPQILQKVDVFITHGGGNSVNESIDAGTPMVVIPFFGDQHLSAMNVEKLQIGKLCQASNMQNHVSNAVKEVLENNHFKRNVRNLKQDIIANPQMLNDIIVNQHALNWQPGDLLFGCNADRLKLAEITGLSDFFRIGDTRPFTQIFKDSFETLLLPRIVDQYHDAFIHSAISKNESLADKFALYTKMSSDYKKHLSAYLEKFTKLQNQTEKESLLWDMCVAGLDYFLFKRKSTIHFVINNYNTQINLATNNEFQWIKNHWHHAQVKNHVKFYLIQNGLLQQVDPEKANWFVTRPTPQFKDIAPPLLNEKNWHDNLTKIKRGLSPSKSKEVGIRFFQNVYPDRFKKEINSFLSSQPNLDPLLNIIDVKDNSVLAKQALATGEVYIFTILQNGRMTLLKRIVGDSYNSHAVCANNLPVMCAGEVRLRFVQANNKRIPVLDISNKSGHYLPTAKSLLKATKIFEDLGFVVHRIKAVRSDIPQTLTWLEKEPVNFSPIKQTREMLMFSQLHGHEKQKPAELKLAYQNYRIV